MNNFIANKRTPESQKDADPLIVSWYISDSIDLIASRNTIRVLHHDQGRTEKVDNPSETRLDEVLLHPDIFDNQNLYGFHDWKNFDQANILEGKGYLKRGEEDNYEHAVRIIINPEEGFAKIWLDGSLERTHAIPDDDMLEPQDKMTLSMTWLSGRVFECLSLSTTEKPDVVRHVRAPQRLSGRDRDFLGLLYTIRLDSVSTQMQRLLETAKEAAKLRPEGLRVHFCFSAQRRSSFVTVERLSLAECVH